SSEPYPAEGTVIENTHIFGISPDPFTTPIQFGSVELGSPVTTTTSDPFTLLWTSEPSGNFWLSFDVLPTDQGTITGLIDVDGMGFVTWPTTEIEVAIEDAFPDGVEVKWTWTPGLLAATTYYFTVTITASSGTP
ncbi:unnamed protein product, partial [marine sediment metagenome]